MCGREPTWASSSSCRPSPSSTSSGPALMSETRRKRGEIAGLRHVSEATIYYHVFTTAARGGGGALAGGVPRLGGPPLITGAIPALKADEQRATLTFTQEAWAHVHQVLDRDFDGDQI